MNTANSQAAIHWRQVWGLAALLAAIVFSWEAYGFYQPQILRNLGFVELAAWLGILQGLMGSIIEPIVGWFSDRIMRSFGSRLPAIAVGVTLAGAIFVAVSWLVERNLPESIRWLVPVLMTVWVAAMIVFRGPAIAMLQQISPVAQLPKVNAILTVVFALVAALGPLLSAYLKNIGASSTFILGAIALLIGATLLGAGSAKYPPSHSGMPSQLSLVLLPLTFAVGIGAGLAVNFMLAIVPQALRGQLAGVSPEYIASGILFVAALAAMPLSELTVKLNVNTAMLTGLGIVAVCTAIAPLAQNSVVAVALILVAGSAFGLVFVSMIPFALSVLPPDRAGLGTGLYFGGGGMATAIVNGMAGGQGSIAAPPVGLLWVALSFAIAALGIYFTAKQKALPGKIETAPEHLDS